VVIQSDGKIVAAGSTNPPSSSASDFALVRYNADGSLDSTFGTGGVVDTNLGPSDAGVRGLALQTDGKLVAVGTTSTSGGNFHLAVLRYNTDGSLDTTFGSGGEVLDNFPNGNPGGSDDSANAVVLQPDGKIVIVGSFVDSTQRGDAGLARYNSDGSPDTSFNGSGKQTLIVPNGVNDGLNAVALQSNGQIVAAGSNGVPGGSYLIVARYNADGTIDTGFGSSGITSTKFTTGGNDGASSVLLQSDGRIVAAGTANAGGSNSNFSLARYIGGTAADAPLTATGTTVSPTAGAPFTGIVASFTDADPASNVSQYTATITWGDGNTSAGTIAANSSGGFNVTGTNTYAAAGTYTITVQISDVGGATATATSTANVTNLGQSVQHGQAAGISFWHGQRGQTLIDSFSGGSTSTALASWLATTFPNLYGANAGNRNLTGKTNVDVARLYQVLFSERGSTVDAQVLATALNVYATTLSLGGTAATSYGFTVTADGLGADSYNVGSNGAAFGVPNNTTLNVYQILKAANQRAVNGVLYNGDPTLRHEAEMVFADINRLGGL
jgi:uncharacterized delta-60 repeat protein